MFDAIARVLAFFYSLPVVGGSYGLAIIFLTAFLMIVLMPLTIRATRSTIKMQAVQPKLRELQKKYKDDKATLNTELMALYKEEGINPVGGCLPMVAQLPVFLVLFRVLKGLSRRVSETPFYTVAEHARAAQGGSPTPGHTFSPTYLNVNSKMYQDLHGAEKMPFLRIFDLAQRPIDVIHANLLHSIPYVLLILFVVGTSYYQQKQISARQTGAAAANNPMNQQQQMLLKVMPLMSGVWSFAFPAGLVLYWATSNTFRIGQQGYIGRAFYSGKEAEAKAGTTMVDTKGGKASANGKVDTKAESNKSDSSKSDSRADGKSDAKGGWTLGRSPRTRSGPQAPTSERKADPKSDHVAHANGNGSSNGQAKEGDSGHGKMTSDERAAAWDRRRRDKARAQAARSRAEQSSRVTPKGTKPSDSKKKRKR